jgi:hypothetical protein
LDIAERVRIREITNVEGNKLLSIIRRGSGSVVRWRRVHMVLWSAQGMDVPRIAKIALSRPQDHNLPFSTWSLSKPAELLVAEGVVDDISDEGLRVMLREAGVSFQVIKTWKQSNDPDFEAATTTAPHR